MSHQGTAVFLVGIIAATTFGTASACTSLLVTKGASTDGSVTITYTCDGEFHPHLEYLPAADYPAGDSLAITDWSGKTRGWIKQVEHTCAVVHLMNEYQVAIGETTFDGREELRNPDGLLHYWDLMQLALQRARTAREAIGIITGLVAEYGYSSTGESISIGDKDEAWILEIIGPGEGGQGAEWVAMKVPDGYIAAHANKAVIGEFPLNEPENCLYSENVVSFAVERGYYDPKSGKPFLFNEAYCPSTSENRRWGSSRVWSIFRRAAPSMNLSPDYNRGVAGAAPYPLWIKPDKKLALSDVFALMRDHYEGTPYDMTKGVDAGAFGSPLRSRPLGWSVDSVKYGWERSVSTPQTAYSFVSQSRGWLPDKIGGVFWYGLDDTYLSCYTPLYCGITAVPESFTVGSLGKFTWQSAWWVFNLVSNYANVKYSMMAPDVLAVQKEIEGTYLTLQPAVERTAIDLSRTNPESLVSFLTDYSVSHAEQMVSRWRALGEYLLTTYNDGYVQDKNGRPQELGYPESWLRQVLQSKAGQFRLPETDGQPQATQQSD